MNRTGMKLLVLLAACGCNGDSARFADESGAMVALAAKRPWRLEDAPAETVPALTRRVWHGSQVDPFGSPSPDGRTYAHLDQATGDISLRDLESGETRRLTHNPSPWYPGFGLSPRFSRDGSRVVYTWSDMERPYEYELRVVDLAGGEPRTIYAEEPTPWINAEDWSPDGKTITAGRFRKDNVVEALLISVEDGSARVLKTFDWQGSSGPDGVANFSPDGRFIVYDWPTGKGRSDRDLYVIAVDGSEESRLLDHPANDFVLGWAPDGRVLFGSDRTGTLGAWLLPVRNGRASGAPVLVKPDLWRAISIGFARDGRYFYAVNTGSSEIYVATLDAESRSVISAPVRLEAATLGLQQVPEWSPDGRYLAYFVRTGGKPSSGGYVAVRSLQTGEVRKLELPPGFRFPMGLRWMPEGRTLLLWARSDEGEALLRIDVQTGQTDRPFPIATSSPFGATGFEILPGGEALLYRGYETTPEGQPRLSLRIRTFEDGAEREIFSLVFNVPTPPAGEVRGLWNPTLSRDGRQVAFRDGPGNDAKIMVMPAAGGEPRALPARAARSLTFTPDGQALLFTTATGANDARTRVYRVSLQGGDPEPIGLAMEGIRDIRFHPDGRRIVFTAGSPEEYELWVMENFLTDEGGGASSPSGD